MQASHHSPTSNPNKPRLNSRSRIEGPVKISDIEITAVGTMRSEAMYRKKYVWVEWKICSPESAGLMEDRIMKFAILLGTEHKPEHFGAQHCMGYFGDVSDW